MDDISTLAATPRHPVDDPTETMAAAEYLDAELTAGGLDVQRIDVTVLVGGGAGVTLPVIWAELGAGGDAPTFVLTAHYDTVSGSPGADDDASGCAGVLEVARVLARAIDDGLTLATTVVVAGLPFEEYGPPYPASRALGEALLAEGRPLTGMLSAEMIGYAQPAETLDDPGDTLLLLGYEGAEALVAQFADAAERFAVLPTGGGTFPADTDFIDRSDHAAFHALGVPAMFATDGANFRTPHYHRASDTPDTIVEPFLLACAQTILGGVCLHSLATGP